MLKEIQAAYLDLIVQAAEAEGNSCLLKKVADNKGAIYVTFEIGTRAQYVIAFDFQFEGVTLGVNFMDGRAGVLFNARYEEGIDRFFPMWRKAMNAGRIEHKAA